MKNTEAPTMTGQQIVDAVRAGTMTQDEVLAILMARMTADREAPRVLFFGKAPADGWKDSDKVAE